MADEPRFYWCLSHSMVEEGERCRAQDRLGPYDSADAARDWKQTHEQRQEKWEDEDEDWEAWPDEKG